VDERFAIEDWPAWISWILGCFALYCFTGCALCNAWYGIRGIVGLKTESIVPLCGGVCGYVGLGLLPVEGADALKYWPLVLDYGTLVTIIWLPILMALYVVHEFWGKARRVFERAPEDDSPEPLQFYGQRVERDSEDESDD
jgi:hypothetical protein